MRRAVPGFRFLPARLQTDGPALRANPSAACADVSVIRYRRMTTD